MNIIYWFYQTQEQEEIWKYYGCGCQLCEDARAKNKEALAIILRFLRYVIYRHQSQETAPKIIVPKKTSIKHLKELLSKNFETKSEESGNEIFQALLHFPQEYFARYPNFRHAVIEKLMQYEFYPNHEVQASIRQLKEYIFDTFMHDEFQDGEFDNDDFEFVK